MNPSLVQQGNILKRQLFKVLLNVSYHMSRNIICYWLRNEKGGTNDISCSETRPFLFQPVKRFRKAGIYKKLFRAITVFSVIFKGEIKSRLRDISNAATHLYFFFSHHTMWNLFICSCFSLVHLKEKEQETELQPRMNSCKPHYCVYYLLRQLF